MPHEPIGNEKAGRQTNSDIRSVLEPILPFGECLWRVRRAVETFLGLSGGFFGSMSEAVSSHLPVSGAILDAILGSLELYWSHLERKTDPLSPLSPALPSPGEGVGGGVLPRAGKEEFCREKIKVLSGRFLAFSKAV